MGRNDLSETFSTETELIPIKSELYPDPKELGPSPPTNRKGAACTPSLLTVCRGPMSLKPQNTRERRARGQLCSPRRLHRLQKEVVGPRNMPDSEDRGKKRRGGGLETTTPVIRPVATRGARCPPGPALQPRLTSSWCP